MSKNAADKIATADQVDKFQLLEYPFKKSWFFLLNYHL